MNPQRSSSDAQNADTHSGNTHKHYDFDVKGKILKLGFELTKLGYSETYVKTLIRALNSIASKVKDFENTDVVSMLIAKGKWKSSYKANLCDFYNHYCKFYDISFCKPKYRRDHRVPRVPTEEKINLIIGHASKKYALIYSIIKECGLRPVEVGNLTLNDIDLGRGLLSVETAKHGRPRVLKLKEKTLAMLIKYAKSKNFNANDTIFPPSSVICNTYGRLRTSIAKKLSDPELRKMRLYDLRHYYATMLYYRTKDILLVKEKLGHRNINNTLIYTHLVNFNEKEEFHSATATTVEDARKLIEEAFEYVTEIDGIKLFRKRK